MDFKTLMEKRRSVNFFDPNRDVDEETLRTIVEIAALTPSGFNFQPWGLVVVRSQEERDKLRKLAWDQPKVSEAPVVLVVLGDKTSWKEGHPDLERAWEDLLEKGYMKDELRGMLVGGAKALHEGEEKSLAFAAKNASMFAMSLMLAAKEVGVETHPMEGFDHDGVLKALGLEDHYFIPMMLALGHFNEDKDLGPAKWRKSYEELVLKEI